MLHPGGRRHDDTPSAAPRIAYRPAAVRTPTRWSTIAAGSFRMGDDSVWAYPGDGEASGPRRRARRVPHRPLRGHQRRVRRVRRRDRMDHRRRALRLVVRVRRAAPRRLPRHARRRRRRVVAPGVRRRLAPPRRTGVRTRRPRRPSRGARVVERRGRVLPLDRAPASRPRPSGSARRAAGGSAPRSRGATTSSPAASTA